MALSAVYRTGQRFGAAHIVDVLRGRDTERIRRFGHDRLPTFGVGGSRSARAWRAVLRQMAANGLLVVDGANFGGLRLGPDARAVLRGEREVRFRREEEPRRARPRRERAAAPADSEGFEALRALRRTLAQEQGVPPYVVFHDSVLAAMLERRPASLEELAAVPGVGAAKLRRYGNAFLEALGQLPPAAAEDDPRRPAALRPK